MRSQKNLKIIKNQQEINENLKNIENKNPFQNFENNENHRIPK